MWVETGMNNYKKTIPSDHISDFWSKLSKSPANYSGLAYVLVPTLLVTWKSSSKLIKSKYKPDNPLSSGTTLNISGLPISSSW